ncbi:hypothetical protein SKAU_G00359500 [Synaphobranchus kaupii]|uniref:Uncharacterized protein n=1 Tax=Synaphobranchus kaupii TaxID=118154 RepID=A0A9Q1IGY9_SYNKA|nr:hypothetical protein SKAU_G00359500 [Synaphobranchus kaupii]
MCCVIDGKREVSRRGVGHNTPRSSEDILGSMEPYLMPEPLDTILFVQFVSVPPPTMGCVMCSQLMNMWNVSVKRPSRRAMELSLFPEASSEGYQQVCGLHYMSSFSDAEDCCAVCECPPPTMGCVMCSQLMNMWNVSVKRPSRRAMELSLFPEASSEGYQQVCGLHYMSSFSDAEDCCDDVTPNSSSSTDCLEAEQ